MTAKTKKSSVKKSVVKSHKQWHERLFESDSSYLLKLVIIVIIGTFWLKFSHPVVWLGLKLNALPLGLAIGLLAVRYFEKHQADRKIWYAMLVVVTLISYFVAAGIVV